MSSSRSRIAAVAVASLAVGFLPSCGDKKKAVSNDLSEAGFQMTAEDWFRASRENNVEALKKFLGGGFSKDTRDEAGNTALHASAAAGAEDSAKFLLERGIPIDVVGAGGRTPLMAAVVAKEPGMVKWFLRQGADPKVQDAEGFTPLMLAVREGSAGAVEELASYDRENLDRGLLLAALLGRADVIDSLTNYGASVYARMEDGRTPLMIAAENGHTDAVKLLLDIGASRYTADSEGKTAAALATEAGHSEIAAMINREPQPDELALTSPEEISAEMDDFVAAAEGDLPADTTVVPAENVLGDGAPRSSQGGEISPKRRTRVPSVPIDGAVLGARSGGESPPRSGKAAPPVVMRYYRESAVPIEVAQVSGSSATLRIAGPTTREVTVREGESIPGSNLVVIKVRRRMEDSKLTDGKPMEVSVVEVSDSGSGATREWISGRESSGHDPIALVEDPVTGRRYTAKPGQRFKSADGSEYLITDVRANQVVIEDLSDGTVQTVPLIGPRG